MPTFLKWEKTYQAKVATAPMLPEKIDPTYASAKERAQWAAADDFSFVHFVGLDMSGPLTKVDLPALGIDFPIPIFIIQGQDDLTAVPELAKAYVDSIKAPRKQFYLVLGTGHEPSIASWTLTRKVLLKQVRPLAK